MPVYFDKRNERWRFELNRVIEGRRVRVTKLLPKGWGRAKAEKYERERTSRLYALATGVEREDPTIGHAVALYLEHRIPRLRDGRGIAQELAHIAGYIDGRPMSELADVCREYAAENAELAAGTIRNRLAYLRASCRYAWRKHKLTAFDPTGQMELPIVDNARDVKLPLDEYESLILKKIENDEARALFTLAFYTGSRWPSEILPRAPGDVHRIRVNGKAKVLLEVGQTKNGTPRMVPVHPKARWALDYPPFKHSQRYYYDRFNPVRAAAGMPELVPHAGRHIVATDIIQRGGSLADVSAALHHKYWGSSARYAHLVTDHTERVLFSLGKARKSAHNRNGARKKKAA